VDLRQVNKRVLECLIKAGALDSFGERGYVLAAVDGMVAASQQAHLARETGQISLFGGAFAAASQPLALVQPSRGGKEATLRDKLLWEKELIGVYVSEHPLVRWGPRLAEIVSAYSGELTEEMAGQVVTVAGVVQEVRRTTTRRGDAMAFVRLEDSQGAIEVVVFPRTFKETQDFWQVEKILIVKGKLDARGDRVNVVCDSVTDEITSAEVQAPPQPPASARQRLIMHLPRSGDIQADRLLLRRLCDQAVGFAGEDELSVLVSDRDRSVRIDFPNLRTCARDDVGARLEADLGLPGHSIEPIVSGGA
jgi:DNA polymerase-3 subunit alpha